MDEKTNLNEKKYNHFSVAEFIGGTSKTNPWSYSQENLKSLDYDKYVELVNECRFFYRTEPLVSTVINKLVEIAINDIVISKNGLTDNEFRVFKSMKPKLLQFAEEMALESLLSGLVVPEVKISTVLKDDLKLWGIKRFDSLQLPVSMWVRDPKTIKISTSMMSDTPSYYLVIPDEVIYFIQNDGKYSSGEEDKNMFDLLKTLYPEFVKLVKKGERQILLENKYIFRRRYLSDDPYPIPYIASALDALKHKRNMRRMDYSLTTKVIGAFLHAKVGNNEFPVTDDEEDQAYLDNLRTQLNWRFRNNNDLDRVFQLITNHTVELNWVFPDVQALINDSKYIDINQEILFGLGFPRVLITGESQRSGSATDPEISLISPIKTMENIRRKVLEVIRNICRDVAIANNFKDFPEVRFVRLNLNKFGEFIDAINKLYDVGGLSRQSLGDFLGYDFDEELMEREREEKLFEKLNIAPVGLNPFGGKEIQTLKQNNQENTQNTDTEVQNER